MKTLLRPVAVLFVWMTLWIASPAAKAASVAFLDVTVIPMDAERVLPRQTVVVTDGRIAFVGPAADAKIPDGAQRIDGAGKFLIPGLGEMHGHNPPPGSSREYTETIYFLFVANGVTTVRGMLGWPDQLELRDLVNRGEMLGPTLYLAGPSFSGQSVHSPAQAEARVREQKAQGWDLLKVHPGVRRDVYDAMAKTAKEVGIRFAGHVPSDVGLAHALEQGQETIDHLDGYIEFLQAERGPIDRAKLAEAVKLTRETGAWVVPTMVVWETILGAAPAEQRFALPELKYLPRSVVDNWKNGYEQRLKNPNFDLARARHVAANREELLRGLHEGGVRMLFGTDAPQQFSVPGFSIHREMQAMAKAGMSPYQILRSATANVGEYFQAKDAFGTVTKGQRADLVLLEANPLEDVAHVAQRAGVMVRGRWLPEVEIQARLEKIAAGSK